MTSVTHAAASSSILLGRRAHATSSAGWSRFGADSKAVRMGLGVAIAAVMAGDVYAVLRSPVSEGTSASRGGAGSAASASAAPAADEGASGFVATNPFGEASYGAAQAIRFVAPVAAAGAGPSFGAGAPSAVPAPVLSTPAASAPAWSSPVAPVISFVPPAGPDPQTETPAPGVLAPVVELVPQAAPVATIVEDIVASVPASVSVAEVVPVPLVAPVAPGGLPL